MTQTFRWDFPALGDKPSPLIFSDGFENQNHTAWAGGSGGRHASCDCTLVCPAGTPDTGDPLDSYIADGAGYFRRTTLRAECKSLIASCLNACELLKMWTGYQLGVTEYLAHRIRIVAPFTPTLNWCVVTQPTYPQIKYNGLSINLIGSTFELNVNGGFSDPDLHYENDDAWIPRAGQHPVAVDEWHDYITKVTYSTIYGTDGTHPVAGELKFYHRKPDTSPTWDLLFDSVTDSNGTRGGHDNALGVPTMQWGYNLSDILEVDNMGLNDPAGTPRNYVDKMGAYRDGANTADFTVDHRKFAIASTFAKAEEYLDWLG